MTVGCQVIEKEFYKKNGKPTGKKELYLRCSVQDYFIKICESNYTEKELTNYINKGITAEIEIIEGEWDICNPNDHEIQSRIGKYAVIKKILK